MKFSADIIDLINSTQKIKIIEFLLNHKAFMSEREIASVLSVSHMSVNRTMKALAGLNLTQNTVIGNSYLWRVNCKSYAFDVLSKIVSALSKLKYPLDDLKWFILKHLPKKMILKIVIFGSIAKQEEKASSDIDVFILVPNSKIKAEIGPFLEKLSLEILDRYGNAFSPYVLTERELKLKGKMRLISEIQSGIQIYPSQ